MTIPAGTKDIVLCSTEGLIVELFVPKDIADIWKVSKGAEDVIVNLLEWLSKVTSGVVGVNKCGSAMAVLGAAEGLEETFLNKGLTKGEVESSVPGLLGISCVCKDKTGVWVTVTWDIKADVLFTVGDTEELVVKDVIAEISELGGLDVDNNVVSNMDGLVKERAAPEGSLGVREVFVLCTRGAVFNSVYRLECSIILDVVFAM